MTTLDITESLGEVTESSGNLLLRLITPGWGSSGYYSESLLQEAATNKVWASGTPVFFDHPSESERHDRPERSVRDLAAVMVTDAHWDGEGLVSEAKVIGPYKDLITDPTFIEAVGMSIRADGEGEVGEAEGREGVIVTSLTEGHSVDLVTKAGRGGKILAVMEAARGPVTEAMADGETRNRLEAILPKDHYLIDFDPDAKTVVYRDWGVEGLCLQSYDESGLTGEVTRVYSKTTYVPVGEEPTPSNPTPVGETKENGMAEIEEDRLQVLEESHGRVESMEAEIKVLRNREAFRAPLTQVLQESGLPVRKQNKILTEALANTSADSTEENILEAAKSQIADAKADLAELAESLGVGQVKGFGESQASTSSLEDFDAIFGKGN